MATKNPFSLLDSDSEGEQKSKTTKPVATKKNVVSRKPVAPKQAAVAANRNRAGGNAPAYEAGTKEQRKPRSGRDTHGHRNPEHQVKKGKRDFERRSGTGRGKEIKKDGAGSRNWGQPGDETKPVEGETAEESTETEAAVPEEPEVPELTLEDFEAMRAEKRQGEAFAELSIKTASDEKIDGEVYSKKSTQDAENETFLMMGSKKDKRSRERNQGNKERVVDVNFKVQSSAVPQWEERPARGGRGGRGRGRGRGRGGRGSNAPRQAGGAPVNPMDASAFPALGGN